ncbi:ADP-ribosylation factor-like protein 16 [Zeugodacus cucurbitae]|uniref:ADP-ribosylation factor-like protein 16 n=1 Tax=Zeugodacus cucurbitae TaxID=28588 RepID=UPI00059687DB|nr:ADP-ribosylation factor-like protein 16 [Zeugodacus cucurbitae]XP_054083251.1 ADP-ribosylation factor-like protein 16 [Zeugodacus cucurbitae]
MDSSFVSQMSCICVGPKRAGKTHLLKALENPDSIDETTYSMPTNGTNIFTINLSTKLLNSSNPNEKKQNNGKDDPGATEVKRKKPKAPLKCIRVLEIGGAMAPLWRQYYEKVSKIIYVVDTSNLCQISAAGVLLYSILAEPRLQRCRILLVLAKMDYAYRQMRNEALLMLQISKLQKEIRQELTIVEASAVSQVGLEAIHAWLQIP